MPSHAGLSLESSLFSTVLANVKWNYSQGMGIINGLQTLLEQLKHLFSEVQAFCTISLEQLVLSFHQRL